MTKLVIFGTKSVRAVSSVHNELKSAVRTAKKRHSQRHLLPLRFHLVPLQRAHHTSSAYEGDNKSACRADHPDNITSRVEYEHSTCLLEIENVRKACQPVACFCGAPL